MVKLEEKKSSKVEDQCCCSGGSCIESTDLNLQNVTETSEVPTDKIQIDIFVPLNECACLWDQFMNKVFEVITPFMKHINFNTKNVNSEEAHQLNVRSNAVIINMGERKFTSPFTLQKELPQILHEKGFI